MKRFRSTACGGLSILAFLIALMIAPLAAQSSDVRGPVIMGPVQYDFTVKIISGFLEGDVYRGHFAYDPSHLKGVGAETIEVTEIDFKYRGDEYQRNGFDGVPKVRFKDGQFLDIVFVGGPKTKRFGLNAGFRREQFGRNSERFIREGKGYFGYLDKRTFVDGAGKITYRKR